MPKTVLDHACESLRPVDSADRPLTVLHVFRAPLGGLFRHVRDLALGQASMGCRVGLVFDATPSDPATEDAIAELARRLPMGVHRMPMRRGAAVSDVSNAISVLRLLSRLGPDVVHGHGAKGGLYARIGALPPFVRSYATVYTPHGGSVHCWNKRPFGGVVRVIEAGLARRTDAFLFESAFVADRFREVVAIPDDRCRISPNGLRDDEFEPSRPGAQQADFVYLGELRRLKGVDVLIDAMAEIRRRSGRTTSAVIVGSGPDRDVLERHAHAAGLAEGVRFVGRLPSRQAMSMGHVLVVPSRQESLPYTVLEAAAARMPMVATTAGGIPEIFGPYADRLVPPDNCTALATAMLAMRDAPDSERTHAAMDLVDHVRRRFHVSKMIENSLVAYREALNGVDRANTGRSSADSGRLHRF